MSTITLSIENKPEKKFRKAVDLKFGIEKGNIGEKYNVCSGKGKKKIEYVKLVETIIRKKAKIKITKDEDESIMVGDNTKLKKLGWKQENSLEQSIRDQIK